MNSARVAGKLRVAANPVKTKWVVLLTTHCDLLAGLLFFLDLDDFASLEVTAVGADGVRKALVATIGTGDEIIEYQGILRTAAITASLGMFALWMWGHETFSFIHTSDGLEPVWVDFE